MVAIIKKIILSRVTLFTVLALFLGGCSLVSQKDSASLSQFEDRIGEGAVKALVHSDHISVAKVTPDENKNFIIDSQEQELTVEQIETLKDILLKDEGYYFDRKKKCLFIPTLAFLFGTDKEVTIMVGTTCKQVKVIGAEKAIILDYDPMAEELNAFCQIFLSE